MSNRPLVSVSVLLLTLAPLPSCALGGGLTHGAVLTGSAAAGAVVAGPAGAAVGAILGDWAGDLTAQSVSGTAIVRVPVEPGKRSGLNLPGLALASPARLDRMIYLLIAAVLAAILAPAWVGRTLKLLLNATREKDEAWTLEDNTWSDQVDADLAAIKAGQQEIRNLLQ